MLLGAVININVLLSYCYIQLSKNLYPKPLPIYFNRCLS